MSFDQQIIRPIGERGRIVGDPASGDQRSAGEAFLPRFQRAHRFRLSTHAMQHGGKMLNSSHSNVLFRHLPQMGYLSVGCESADAPLALVPERAVRPVQAESASKGCPLLSISVQFELNERFCDGRKEQRAEDS